MSSICPYCNKRVYFAERQTKDGKDYHGGCLQKLLKSEKPKLIGVYPGSEDRVAGELSHSTGLGVRPSPKPDASSINPSSSSEEKQEVVESPTVPVTTSTMEPPQQQQQQQQEQTTPKPSTTTDVKPMFCSECGSKAKPNAKFCSNCGHKLL